MNGPGHPDTAGVPEPSVGPSTPSGVSGEIVLQTVIAEGIWCINCEFFEYDDVIEDDARCQGCGCSTTVHLPVKIVEKKEGQ